MENTLKQDKIVAISGKQLAGKTTAAGYFKQIMPEYEIVHLADALKDEYCEEEGITRETLEEYKYIHRRGLIELGSEGRARDINYWVKKVLNHPNYPKLIIPDVRFMTEIKELTKHHTYFISIRASRKERIKRGFLACEDDPSENDIELEDHEIFHSIINNTRSLRYLEKRCYGIAKTMLRANIPCSVWR